MKTIDAFDFNTYPIAGFRTDRMENVTLNNEYRNTRWYISKADGVPRIAKTLYSPNHFQLPIARRFSSPVLGARKYKHQILSLYPG
jgi:hypothetical protein